MKKTMDPTSKLTTFSSDNVEFRFLSETLKCTTKSNVSTYKNAGTVRTNNNCVTPIGILAAEQIESEVVLTQVRDAGKLWRAVFGGIVRLREMFVANEGPRFVITTGISKKKK